MSALANFRVVNIPACANTVSAADYDANRAALFDPRDPGYYKVRCERAQLDPMVDCAAKTAGWYSTVLETC